MILRHDQLQDIRRILTDDETIWSNDARMNQAMRQIQEIINGRPTDSSYPRELPKEDKEV